MNQSNRTRNPHIDIYKSDKPSLVGVVAANPKVAATVNIYELLTKENSENYAQDQINSSATTSLESTDTRIKEKLEKINFDPAKVVDPSYDFKNYYSENTMYQRSFASSHDDVPNSSGTEPVAAPSSEQKDVVNRGVGLGPKPLRQPASTAGTQEEDETKNFHPENHFYQGLDPDHVANLAVFPPGQESANKSGENLDPELLEITKYTPENQIRHLNKEMVNAKNALDSLLQLLKSKENTSWVPNIRNIFPNRITNLQHGENEILSKIEIIKKYIIPIQGYFNEQAKHYDIVKKELINARIEKNDLEVKFDEKTKEQVKLLEEQDVKINKLEKQYDLMQTHYIKQIQETNTSLDKLKDESKTKLQNTKQESQKEIDNLLRLLEQKKSKGEGLYSQIKNLNSVVTNQACQLVEQHEANKYLAAEIVDLENKLGQLQKFLQQIEDKNKNFQLQLSKQTLRRQKVEVTIITQGKLLEKEQEMFTEKLNQMSEIISHYTATASEENVNLLEATRTVACTKPDKSTLDYHNDSNSAAAMSIDVTNYTSQIRHLNEERSKAQNAFNLLFHFLEISKPSPWVPDIWNLLPKCNDKETEIINKIASIHKYIIAIHKNLCKQGETIADLKKKLSGASAGKHDLEVKTDQTTKAQTEIIHELDKGKKDRTSEINNLREEKIIQDSKKETNREMDHLKQVLRQGTQEKEKLLLDNINLKDVNKQTCCIAKNDNNKELSLKQQEKENESLQASLSKESQKRQELKDAIYEQDKFLAKEQEIFAKKLSQMSEIIFKYSEQISKGHMEQEAENKTSKMIEEMGRDAKTNEAQIKFLCGDKEEVPWNC